MTNSLLYNHRLVSPSSPLAVLIHGKGGNMDVMQPFERTLSPDHNIIRVQAPIVDSEIGGFSWWQFSPHREIDATFQISSETRSMADSLIETVRRFIEHYSLTPEYICCIGFSQGAAMSTLLLQQQKLPVSYAALLCGFALEDPQGARNSQDVFWFHGEEDQTIPLERAKKDVQRLQQHGHAVTFITDKTGHKITVRGMKELKKWLEERR